jgi:hypothetical protein
MTLKDAGSNCGLIRPPAARAAAVLPRPHRLEGASNRRHSRIVKAADDNLQPDRQAGRTVGTLTERRIISEDVLPPCNPHPFSGYSCATTGGAGSFGWCLAFAMTDLLGLSGLLVLPGFVSAS